MAVIMADLLEVMVDIEATEEAMEAQVLSH
jgi:hypothetical protein